MILLISYDLNTPGKDYSGLHKKIKTAGTWWHHLDSTWIIRTRFGPDTWFRRLSPYLDKNDTILIIEITDNYQGWLPERAWDWIEKQFEKED